MNPVIAETKKEKRAVYNAKDIRELMGVSLPVAYDLMNRADFPCLQVGRRKVVPIEAFHRWLDEQARAK